VVGWYVVVSLLDDGAYEVECRDPARGERELVTTADLSATAKRLTVWMAGRFRATSSDR
jgi:hypothetical protein